MTELESLLPLLMANKITVSEASERCQLSKRYIYKMVRRQASTKRSLTQKKNSLMAELQRIELALAHQRS